MRGEVLALSFAFFYLIWCGLTEVLQVKPQFLKPANRYRQMFPERNASVNESFPNANGQI
ncbi:hypothetical protein BCY91_17195 [Pelobium manganitolerans]|uniref:Uncharacterized protein n=1 Tax=Pelobium manganitolerans TaxID=1842495 RepID=A0A419S6B8_9SPHI|nr:hypothetical protein BCY91_17195 [Pelobium manganitolerans]